MVKLHADQPANISQQYLLNAPLLSNKQGFRSNSSANCKLARGFIRERRRAEPEKKAWDEGIIFMERNRVR